MEEAEMIDVRTLLVSDVHLGCKHARAAEFLRFLKRFRPDNIYLVGDFIDAWKINAGWHWSEECDEVVDHLIELTQRNTRIFYVPGNHDSFLRNPAFRAMLPAELLQIDVADEFVFKSHRGWDFLVTHGDFFDVFETKMQWISKASTFFYDTCLSLNRYLSQTFLDSKQNPYGGCAVLKDRVKRGVRFVSNFETKIMQHARSRKCEGVICGHIHTPDIINDSSILYCNTGDWVENCTGLVEHVDGTISLVSLYGEDQHLDLPMRVDTEAFQDDTDDDSTEDESPESEPSEDCRKAEEVAA
tara:strand:+ start:19063 stop:19962 length:900 start_codon:yes stop_codon:yes gene_type:complete